jgi:hypothetical protein
MKSQIQEIFKKVAERRAERLGISTGEVLREVETPRFVRSAEKRARRRGRTVEEVLRDDLEAMRQSGYPGPDCLAPHEIEGYRDSALIPRPAHLERCDNCRYLLQSIAPNNELMNEFVESTRVLAATTRGSVGSSGQGQSVVHPVAARSSNSEVLKR